MRMSVCVTVYDKGHSRMLTFTLKMSKKQQPARPYSNNPHDLALVYEPSQAKPSQTRYTHYLGNTEFRCLPVPTARPDFAISY